MILFSANQQRRASDFIGQIFFHCFCKNSKTMSGKLCIPLFIPIIDHHDIIHQSSSILRSRHSICPRLQKRLPWVIVIHRFHSFQKPKFNTCYIFSLQRCRINGNKACQAIGIKLRIRLSHISAHRLAYKDRRFDCFQRQNVFQPSCLIKQIKVETKWPRRSVSRCIPSKNIAFFLKVGNLSVKQSMVSR